MNLQLAALATATALFLPIPALPAQRTGALPAPVVEAGPAFGDDALQAKAKVEAARTATTTARASGQQRLVPPMPEAVSAGNYAFSTGTTGSLTDLSTGATTIVGPDLDDVGSLLQDIGFEFFFQGARYTQFGANTNGVLRLGARAQSAAPYQPLGQAGVPVITAWGADQRTSFAGAIRFKVIGSAPSRILVVEWLRLQTEPSSYGSADLHYQVRLAETTGVIEFVYGNMVMSAAGAALANAQPHLGFSSGNAAGTIGTLTVPQNGTPAPSFSGTAGAAVVNAYAAGPIAALTSAADGARRTFTFTPPTPTAPTGLSFSNATPTGITLNWTDSPDDVGYAIYRSPSGGPPFEFDGLAAENATSYAASNLPLNSTHVWQVYALSEGRRSAAPISGQGFLAFPGVISSTPAGGPWSSPSTWSGGVVPTSNDLVSISQFSTVTIDASVACQLLFVNGTLLFEAATARTVTVAESVLISSSGSFRSASSGSVTTHTLSVGRNLVVDAGELDFSTNGNTAGANLVFTGTTDAVFTCGLVTDIRSVTVNKGTSSAPLLTIRGGVFTVRGVNTDSAGWLTLLNGTCALAGSTAGTNRVFTSPSYTIPATAGFWLNNPNYTVAGHDGLATVSGTLRVSQGTFNAGATGGSLLFADNASLTRIEGGTLNVSGRFGSGAAAVVHMTGGTLNVSTMGNNGTGPAQASFAFSSPTALFQHSGGTVNLVQAAVGGAAPVDYNFAGTLLAADGTVRVGTAATATNFNFRLQGKTAGLVIDNTGTPKTATASAALSIYGPPLVPAGSTLALNGAVVSTLAPTFTNHGTIDGTAAGSRLYFLGTAVPQTLTGSGAITAPLASLDCDNDAGLILDPALPAFSTTRINLLAGGLANASKLTLANGSSSFGTIQLGVANQKRLVSGFDVAPVFNVANGECVLMYAQELGLRTTGPEVLGSRVLGTLVVNNPNGVILAGDSLRVTNATTLTAGQVFTGPDFFLDTATSDVTRTSGYVNGNLRKTLLSGSKIFELGTDSGYLPLTITSSLATIQASTKDGLPSFLGGASNAVARSWTISSSVSASVTVQYLASEAAGNPANYRFLRRTGTVTTVYNPSGVPTSTSATIALSNFTGEWGLAELLAPTFASAAGTVFQFGQPGSFFVAAQAVPGATLSLTGGTLPAGVSFNAGTGELSGTPGPGTGGSYPLTFRATNGTPPDATQNFTLIVNRPPVAGAHSLATRQGVPASVAISQLRLNDSDPDGDPLSIVGVASPSAQGASVGLNAGNLTYAPLPAFFGSDTVTYTLADNQGGQTTGTINVTVAPSGAGTFSITGLTLPNGVPTLQAFGIVGRFYELQHSDDLTGIWTPLGAAPAGPDGMLMLTDPTVPPLPPKRFYRLRQPQ